MSSVTRVVCATEKTNGAVKISRSFCGWGIFIKTVSMRIVERRYIERVATESESVT